MKCEGDQSTSENCGRKVFRKRKIEDWYNIKRDSLSYPFLHAAEVSQHDPYNGVLRYGYEFFRPGLSILVPESPDQCSMSPVCYGRWQMPL